MQNFCSIIHFFCKFIAYSVYIQGKYYKNITIVVQVRAELSLQKFDYKFN